MSANDSAFRQLESRYGYKAALMYISFPNEHSLRHFERINRRRIRAGFLVCCDEQTDLDDAWEDDQSDQSDRTIVSIDKHCIAVLETAVRSTRKAEHLYGHIVFGRSGSRNADIYIGAEKSLSRAHFSLCQSSGGIWFMTRLDSNIIVNETILLEQRGSTLALHPQEQNIIKDASFEIQLCFSDESKSLDPGTVPVVWDGSISTSVDSQISVGTTRLGKEIPTPNPHRCPDEDIFYAVKVRQTGTGPLVKNILMDPFSAKRYHKKPVHERERGDLDEQVENLKHFAKSSAEHYKQRGCAFIIEERAAYVQGNLYLLSEFLDDLSPAILNESSEVRRLMYNVIGLMALAEEQGFRCDIHLGNIVLQGDDPDRVFIVGTSTYSSITNQDIIDARSQCRKLLFEIKSLAEDYFQKPSRDWTAVSMLSELFAWTGNNGGKMMDFRTLCSSLDLRLNRHAWTTIPIRREFRLRHVHERGKSIWDRDDILDYMATSALCNRHQILSRKQLEGRLESILSEYERRLGGVDNKVSYPSIVSTYHAIEKHYSIDIHAFDDCAGACRDHEQIVHLSLDYNHRHQIFNLEQLQRIKPFALHGDTTQYEARCWEIRGPRIGGVYLPRDFLLPLASQLGLPVPAMPPSIMDRDTSFDDRRYNEWYFLAPNEVGPLHPVHRQTDMVDLGQGIVNPREIFSKNHFDAKDKDEAQRAHTLESLYPRMDKAESTLLMPPSIDQLTDTSDISSVCRELGTRRTWRVQERARDAALNRSIEEWIPQPRSLTSDSNIVPYSWLPRL